MARKRRSFEIFSMSFLDCISCGFGAVILLFMIINAQATRATDAPTQRLMAEVSKLQYEILEERKDYVLAKNTMEELENERARAASEIEQITALIERLKAEIEERDKDALARMERIEKLQAEIESLEEIRKELLAAKASRESGSQVRSFTGEGDRQYLTGLKVGGQRILVLVDASASMLDRRIINILRRRNMPPERRLLSEKWRQVVNSVDWLSAQFPPTSKFQIYAFNTTAWPVLEGGRFRGIASLSDVRKRARDSWSQSHVRDVMTPAEAVLTVRPQDESERALLLIAQRGVNQLPVMDGERLVGLVRREDILRWLSLHESAFEDGPRRDPL